MMEQTFTIEIKGGDREVYICIMIMLCPAPPSVRITNKPGSGEMLVQEGDTVELDCQVWRIIVI